jgi:hypothetical protein
MPYAPAKRLTAQPLRRVPVAVCVGVGVAEAEGEPLGAAPGEGEGEGVREALGAGQLYRRTRWLEVSAT